MPNQQPPPPFATQLRQFRLARGLTSEELARSANVSQATLSRLENGKVRPAQGVVDRLATALDLHGEDAKIFRLLAQRGPSTNRLVSFRLAQGRLFSLEEQARSVRSFHHAVIPGPLQTRDYAGLVFKSMNEVWGRGQRDPEPAIRARLARQQLVLASPEKFQFVLTEGALRTRVLSAEATIRQLASLDLFMREWKIDLRIIPLTSVVPVMPVCNFSVFDKRRVVVEALSAEMVVDDPEEVHVYDITYEAALAEASAGAEAVYLLQDVIADFRKEIRQEPAVR